MCNIADKLSSSRCDAGDHKPYVDEAGLVHWPLLFVYPETMQMDAVEDASELDSLGDHLDAMFSPDAPPLEWDRDHEYTRERLEVYYLSHAAEALTLGELAEVRSFHLLHALHAVLD